MASRLNGYFNNTGNSIGNRNERNLVQRLVDQSIQIHGFSITYVNREENESDLHTVWREDTSPEFVSSFTIEAFLESYDGFEGNLVQNTPWGLGIDQMAKILISKARWQEEKDFHPNLEIPNEPQAGDLILMSFGADDNTTNVFGDESNHVEIQQPKIFEILYSEREPDKQQLRGRYYYEITLRLFDHSNEDISYTNTDSNNDTQTNYIFNEQELTNNLKTSGLDTIFANIDQTTGEETGNIREVVKTAQNRDLEINSNQYSEGHRQPSTGVDENGECASDNCTTDGNGNPVTSDNKKLVCDNTITENPFDLPDKW